MTLLRNRYTWIAGLALAGVVLAAPAAEARGPFMRFGFVSMQPPRTFMQPARNFAHFGLMRPMPGFVGFNRPFVLNNGFGFRPFIPATGFVGSGVPFPTAQSINMPFQPTFLQRSALQNWAFNTNLIGRTYAQFPPWIFGYNPYPPLITGMYYGGGYSPFAWGGYGPWSNPLLYSNPYTAYSAGYAPWSGAFNPYSSAYNPWLTAFNPYTMYGLPYTPTANVYSTGYNPYSVP